MTSILLGSQSVQAQLFASIFDYKESILIAYHQQLLSYLQENSVFYRNEKNCDGNAHSFLVPKINNFCTYQDGGKRTHFGVVDEILKDNVVSLRVIKKGRLVHQNTLVRTFRMIYRPKDEKIFLNMDSWCSCFDENDVSPDARTFFSDFKIDFCDDLIIFLYFTVLKCYWHDDH